MLLNLLAAPQAAAPALSSRRRASSGLSLLSICILRKQNMYFLSLSLSLYIYIYIYIYIWLYISIFYMGLSLLS